MTTKLAKILAEARLAAGMSQADLAEKLGISRQAVASWERSETGPRRKYIIKIAEILRISPAKLDPLTFGQIQGSVHKVDLKLETTPIPILSISDVPSNASGDNVITHIQTVTSEKIFVSGEYARCFAVEITTDEMDPIYQNGDICLIDPAVKPEHGDDVVVSVQGQKSMLRRVSVRGKDPSGFVVMDLTTPNLALPTLTITKGSHYVILGTVVEYRRRRKSSAGAPPPLNALI